MVEISDRLAKLRQRQNRDELKAAALREEERKARRRKLIAVGALVEKAGLLSLEASAVDTGLISRPKDSRDKERKEALERWNTAALYGALMSLQQGSGDTKTLERWAKTGQTMLDREAAEKTKVKMLFVITYPEEPPLEQQARKDLRAAGFRFNRFRGEWEGEVEHDVAERLAGAHNGKLARLDGGGEGLRLAAE